MRGRVLALAKSSGNELRPVVLSGLGRGGYVRVLLDVGSAAESEKETQLSSDGSISKVDESEKPSQVEIPPVILETNNFRNLEVTPLAQIPCVLGKGPEPVT